METFTVNRSRVLRYISKYFAYCPEEYFEVEDCDDPYIVKYSIHESAFSTYNETKSRKTRNITKEKIEYSLEDQLKSENKTQELEELIFLLFYLAASRNNKGNMDFSILNRDNNIINILQSLILIKEHGLHNLEFVIKHKDNKRALPASFYHLEEYYLSLNHYLSGLATFVGEDIKKLKDDYFSDEPYNNLQQFDIDQLKELKEQLSLRMPDKEKIDHVKGILMLRDYLMDQFGLKSKGMISDKQTQIIYRAYHKMGWLESSDNPFADVDKLQKFVEYQLKNHNSLIFNNNLGE